MRNDTHFTTLPGSGQIYCFLVQSETLCETYAHVFATDEDSARARMAALFRGCELILADPNMLPDLHMD